jgi:hypothetical protein
MRAHAGADGRIFIKVRIYDKDLRLYVKSKCALDSAKVLRQQASNILTSEPRTLYFDRLSRPCQSDKAKFPDLSLLLMIVDYDADLAWKFEGDDSESAAISVTTMTAMRI